MIKTEICDIINIKYPIVQGAMAWISDAELACAVSEAGGLGIVSTVGYSIDTVTAEIRKAKSMTDKPFGVNIMLQSTFADKLCKAVIDEGVSVITTGAGNPSRYMKAWIDAGIKVIPVVASVAAAKMMEKKGAAAVIAEGCESGGHIGELTTMALVPQVCDAVSIPVIAAGGIADGRTLAAAFMLGAKGVQCGTRFLVAKECGVHRIYKNKILKAKDIDTVVTGRRCGHPVRSLKTPFSREYFNMEYDALITDKALDEAGSGALFLAAVKGDEKRGCFMCGQCASMIDKEQTVKEIVGQMFDEAEAVLKSVAKGF